MNIRNLLVGATLTEARKWRDDRIDVGDLESAGYADEFVRELEAEIEDVVFLRGRNDVTIFAVFPGLAATEGNPNHVTCYEHVGQHGAADLAYCAECFEVAEPAGYANLYAELESRGYSLNVVSKDRIPHSSYADKRRSQLR